VDFPFPEDCSKVSWFRTCKAKPGFNYLCQGYQPVFTVGNPSKQVMAGLLRGGRMVNERDGSKSLKKQHTSISRKADEPPGQPGNLP
jgi:hypothetical protein